MNPRITILDVGHGNAAVVTAPDLVVLIDGGKTPTLHQYLQGQGIARVQLLLISHSDEDHVKGFHSVLADTSILVDRVFVNPDQVKNSDSWEDFSQVLDDAIDRGTDVVTALTPHTLQSVAVGGLLLDVLSPAPTRILRMSAPNRLSSVIRLRSEDRGEILFAADADRAGIGELIAADIDIGARILVYPHHGGNCGSSDRDFAEELLLNVNPERVVFSQGRMRYDNPLPEIVRTIQTVSPQVSVGCTQLNTSCGPAWTSPPPHLAQHPSAGKADGYCCLGTLVIDYPEGASTPSNVEHGAFVQQLPSPRCLSL